MNLILRLILLSALLGLLAACSLRPDQSERFEQVNPRLVEAHQQQLAAINAWRIRGRIALIDTLENNRDAASLSWSQNSEGQQLRISHPLRGTLAQLQVSSSNPSPMASLTLPNGETHTATSVEQLLANHAGIYMPFELIRQALVGSKPAQGASAFAYYQDGTLAQYQFADWRSGQQWQIDLSHYQTVAQPSSNKTVLLPHLIEVTEPGFELKLQINQWNLTP